MTVASTELEDALSELFQNETSTLEKACHYALTSGGKRLRPKLLLKTVQALNGNIEAAIQPALAVECIHTYSLVHDDLPCMDDDDYRRGKESVHKAFGEANALLAGDLLMTKAFELLSTAPFLTSDQKVELIKILSIKGGLHGMIGGQFLDMEAEKTPPTLEKLKEIHEKKTGNLIAASVEMGAVIANASKPLQEELAKIALDYGLAFQIQDDILDETDIKNKGKYRSSDKERGKTTYTTLLGVEGAKQMVEEIKLHIEGSLKQYGLTSIFLF